MILSVIRHVSLKLRSQETERTLIISLERNLGAYKPTEKVRGASAKLVLRNETQNTTAQPAAVTVRKVGNQEATNELRILGIDVMAMTQGTGNPHCCRHNHLLTPTSPTKA